MERIDCRGLSCPLPVVETRKHLERLSSGGKLEVLVDTGTARDNVSRLAAREGCDVEVRETEDEEFILTITKK
ncbi:sulfurtransferase TusA family protein [Candidatus Solincola tengchongensis]|uniref:sulfurtransferase TusA family protein n=1 Tax=Candidatus Solincola tengchongensis TaxID=2900693 RepID=UPI00257FC957|nr:sulfurtransferase TusA family protein [Candidatus Solincola tengchongensis]